MFYLEIVMTNTKTLLERLDTEGGDYVRQRTAMVVSKGQEALEESIGEVLVKMKPDLATLDSESVFDIYVEMDDVDARLVTEYMGLVGELTAAKVKHRTDSWLRRALHYTSHSDDRNMSDGECAGWGLLMVGILAAPAVAIPLAMSSAVGIPIGLALGVAADYGVFFRECGLKGDRYTIKSSSDEIVQDAYRLNHLAQIMEIETADIECLDEVQIEALVSEHGGTEGVIRYLEAAQDHARKVRDYTGRVLTAAGVEAPVLSPDYVPTALRGGVKADGLSEEIDVAYEEKVVASHS